MASLAAISSLLAQISPNVYENITFAQLTAFFEAIHRLRPLIVLPTARSSASEELPPLPPAIRAFTSILISLPEHLVQQLWTSVGAIALTEPSPLTNPAGSVDSMLALIGSDQGLGEGHL